MIDTSKYEGHSKGPWYWDGNLCNDEYSEKHGTEQWCVFDWEEGLLAKEEDMRLIADAPLLLAEVKRLSEIEQEWLVMWATLEELNLVADVRKNMTLHGFVFPTDEDMEGDEEE